MDREPRATVQVSLRADTTGEAEHVRTFRETLTNWVLTSSGYDKTTIFN